VNWLDILLLLTLALAVYRGGRTGLVLSCVRLSGLLVACFVAVHYHRALANFLEAEWHVADLLAAWLGRFVDLPRSVESVMLPGVFHLGIAATTPFLDVASLAAPEGSTVRPALYSVARDLVAAGAFLSLFAVTERLWTFAGSHLTFFRRRLPFLLLDGAGGALVGAVRGFLSGAVMVLLYLYVTHLYTVLRGQDNFLARTAETSVLLPYYKGLLRAAAAVLPVAWQKLVRTVR